MFTKTTKLITFFLLALASYGVAIAQVIKCKDAAGKTIYSDVACPSNLLGARVNLSGANITEEQVQAAQEKRADNAGRAASAAKCSLLMNQTQQTFAAFLKQTNRKRWDVSFQALQTFVNSCQSPETCKLVNTRLDHSQQRFNQDDTPTRGAQLNSITSLYADKCVRRGFAEGGG
jgi:hypothetical protein